MKAPLRLLLRSAMWVWRWLLLAPISRALVLGSRRKVPPIAPEDSLLLHSATTLARLIRTRRLTSEQVVTTYIRRVRTVNRILNAVVEPRFDEALQEAKLADTEAEKAHQDPEAQEKLRQQRPLLGVPITVKESIAVEGMYNESGRWRPPADRVPAATDADVISHLKAAGAIIIAVTNTPELCMFWETNNSVFGRTRNPHDTRRCVGGSSGGEAALVTSAASPIGVGSDLIGSLRLPAALVGVFAHKASGGVVSPTGHEPRCHDPKYALHLALGPMARRAEDLELGLSAMISERMRRKLRLDSISDITMGELRFYFLEDDGGSKLCGGVDPLILERMRSFLGHLGSEYGAQVRPLQIPLMETAFEAASLTLLSIDGFEQTPFFDETDPRRLRRVWHELGRYLTCRSTTSFPVIAYGLLKRASQRMRRRSEEAARLTDELRRMLDKELGNDGVLLLPTWTTGAPFHRQMWGRLLDLGLLLPINALGLPATSCPMGVDKRGLPLGVQVAAVRGNDRVTLAVARELERFFGGWTPPACCDLDNK